MIAIQTALAVTRDPGNRLGVGAVFAIADRIRVLHLGSIIAEGTPEEIRENNEVQRIYLGERK